MYSSPMPHPWVPASHRWRCPLCKKLVVPATLGIILGMADESLELAVVQHEKYAHFIMPGPGDDKIEQPDNTVLFHPGPGQPPVRVNLTDNYRRR